MLSSVVFSSDCRSNVSVLSCSDLESCLLLGAVFALFSLSDFVRAVSLKCTSGMCVSECVEVSKGLRAFKVTQLHV